MAFYRGGPCDGLPIDGSFTEPRMCGGVLYAKGADGNYHPDTSASGATGTDALGTKAPTGWHDFQRAVNIRLPTELARTARLRRAGYGRVRRALR